MLKIEMGKQYKTRSGLPVRILATDRLSAVENWSVVAALQRDNVEEIYCFREDGTFHSDRTGKSDFDLIEVKPRIKRDCACPDMIFDVSAQAKDWPGAVVQAGP